VSTSRRGQRSSALDLVESRVRGLLSELAKFGTVGAMSFAIDVAIFNAVLLVLDKPLTAKVISTVFAATNAFLLNRAWSFKHRERTTVRREYSLFFVLNAVGLSISLLCLAVSHYVLGFESRLADNIAANGVGLVLGTAFRFWSYPPVRLGGAQRGRGGRSRRRPGGEGRAGGPPRRDDLPALTASRRGSARCPSPA
jgi:putative flippase GtrA